MRCRGCIASSIGRRARRWGGGSARHQLCGWAEPLPICTVKSGDARGPQGLSGWEVQVVDGPWNLWDRQPGFSCHG